MKFTILHSNDRIAAIFKQAKSMVKQLPLGEMQQHWDTFVKNVADKINDTLQDQIERLALQLKDNEEQLTTLQALHTNLNFRYEELKARSEAHKIYDMKVVNLESQVGRSEKEIYDLKAELKIQCQNRDHFRALVAEQDTFIKEIKKQVEAYKKSKQSQYEELVANHTMALNAAKSEAEHLAKQAIRLNGENSELIKKNSELKTINDQLNDQTPRLIEENEKFREQTTRLVEEKRILTDQLNGLECLGCRTGEHGAHCGGCLGCLLRQTEYALELSNNELKTVKADLTAFRNISNHQSLAMGALYPIVFALTNRWFQPKGVTSALAIYGSACDQIVKEMNTLSTTPKTTAKAVPPPDLKSQPETCCGDINSVI
jgi:hypothetical protein